MNMSHACVAYTKASYGGVFWFWLFCCIVVCYLLCLELYYTSLCLEPLSEVRMKACTGKKQTSWTDAKRRSFSFILWKLKVIEDNLCRCIVQFMHLLKGKDSWVVLDTRSRRSPRQSRLRKYSTIASGAAGSSVADHAISFPKLGFASAMVSYSLVLPQLIVWGKSPPWPSVQVSTL